MAAKPHNRGRTRLIVSAAIMAGSLCAALFGRALVQARSATSEPHHVAVTINRPTNSVGGQIDHGASATDDQQADDADDNDQGDEDTDGD